MLIRIKKSQVTAEYAILLSLVVAAAMGIQNYVKKGWEAAVKARTDMFVQQVAPGASSQYEGIEVHKTTTDQVSERTFVEDPERNAESPFTYEENSSADYTSITIQ